MRASRAVICICIATEMQRNVVKPQGRCDQSGGVPRAAIGKAILGIRDQAGDGCMTQSSVPATHPTHTGAHIHMTHT